MGLAIGTREILENCRLFQKTVDDQIELWNRIINSITSDRLRNEADHKLQRAAFQRLLGTPEPGSVYSIFIPFNSVQDELEFYTEALSDLMMASVIYKGEAKRMLESLEWRYPPASNREISVVNVGLKTGMFLADSHQWSGFEFFASCLQSPRILEICTEKQAIELQGLCTFEDEVMYVPAIKFEKLSIIISFVRYSSSDSLKAYI